MENAVDAIYIAGAVLLMIVALTVSISSFSTQIASVEEIVQADERLDVVETAGGTDFLNYITYNKSTRDVGVETIVNSLYRSYKENYTVYIKFKNASSYTNVDSKIKTKATKQQKDIDGNIIINVNDNILVFKITTEYNLQNAKERLNSILAPIHATNNPNGSDLYRKMIGKKFTEYIGTLYQNDIGSGTRTEEISDANKTIIRIITYVEQ